MTTNQDLLLKIALIVVTVTCTYAQRPRFEYKPNMRRQWYYAFYDCTSRGGTLVNPSNTDPRELQQYLNQVSIRETSLRRQVLENERFWANEECQNYYMVNGGLQPRIAMNNINWCYYPRSWICRFNN